MILINEINEKIKQRPPFQMIDRVLEINPNESALGIKCVSVNEPYFMGHFPGSQIMPGVLIIESCAQLCSLVFEASGTDTDNIYVLLKVDGFKFIKAVIPGDVLNISVTKTKVLGPITTFDRKVMVDGNIYSKGTLSFTKVPKDTIYQR
jgi:3-hydroxyacyl-[acyl-carrier-protein] dehydratase